MSAVPPPPPPEPAFAHWCAVQVNPPSLCFETGDAAWALEVWGLIALFVFLFAGLVVFLMWYWRRAALGGRFCDELDGYDGALKFLTELESGNEARLHSGMRAYSRLHPKRIPK